MTPSSKSQSSSGKSWTSAIHASARRTSVFLNSTASLMEISRERERGSSSSPLSMTTVCSSSVRRIRLLQATKGELLTSQSRFRALSRLPRRVGTVMRRELMIINSLRRRLRRSSNNALSRRVTLNKPLPRVQSRLQH